MILQSYWNFQMDYSRMPMVRLELATPGLQTQCSSHWAIQLKSYCGERVEFIQLVYCIIIRSGGRRSRLVRPFEKNLNLTIIGPTLTLNYKALTINDKIFGPTKVGVVGPAPPALIIYLSFLNCDWLFIREVQWFYWTQELLVPVEKFTVRMPMVRLELATPGLQTQCSSHWAIQLKSYCWEGSGFIQLVYCIIILLFIISQLWLTSHPRSTVVPLDTGTPGTSREIYSEKCRWWDTNSQPLDYKPVL